MDSKKKWALGTTITAVVAFFAGWLTAPQSGKESREDIKETASNAKNEAEKQLKSIHDELQMLLEDGLTRGSELKDKAKAEFDETVAKAADAKDKVEVLLRAVRNKTADDPELASALKQAIKAKDNLKKYWSK